MHFVSLNSETDFPTAEERNTGDSHDKGLPAGHFGRTGECVRHSSTAPVLLYYCCSTFEICSTALVLL